MREWYSSTELAGLPGLPATDRAIRIRAEKDAWKSQPKSKGKGLEYHISNLPAETQSHLIGNAPKSVAELVVAETEASIRREEQRLSEQKRAVAEKSLSELAALAPEKRLIAEAKLAVIAAFNTFLLTNKGMPKVAAMAQYCQQFNCKNVSVDNWVYENVSQISPITLRRWIDTVRAGGAAALAGKARSAGENSKIESTPGLPEFILALVTAKPHLMKKAREVANLIEVKRNERYPHWPQVSRSTAQRYLQKLQLENSSELAYTTNPREYNNSHRPLYGTMYPWVNRPNQVWELDSTPTDVQLNVNGKARRYSIIGAIDVYARRPMLVLMPTSNSEGICMLLRKCFLTWGIPEPDSVIRTDNGSDYVSQRTSGLFSLLELTQSKATAFSGWEKPYIERFFKTVSHGLLEKLPAYVGHNVTDKKRLQEMRSFAESIGAKRKQRDQELLELSLTPEELQTVLDDYIQYDYMHRPHSGLGDKTPFEVYTNSGYRPKMPANPHSLDILLSYVGTATVVRGKVKADGITYSAPELMEPEWNRKTVRVFQDPTDVGRTTLYPDDNWGSYVEAINMDLIGREIDPAQFRQRRKDGEKQLRAFRRNAERLQAEFGIDQIAAVELAQKKMANQALTGFNTAESNSSNAAIAALSKTATALTKDTSKPAYTEAELEAISMRREQLEQRRASLDEQASKVLRSEHEQAEWLTRESMVRQLTEKESQWLTKFRSKPEYAMTRRRLDRILESGKRANG